MSEPSIEELLCLWTIRQRLLDHVDCLLTRSRPPQNDQPCTGCPEWLGTEFRQAQLSSACKVHIGEK